MRERARQILEALFYGAMETPGEAYISTTLHKRGDVNDDAEQLLIGGDGGWDDFDAFFAWIFEIIEDRYYDIGMDHEYRQEFVTDEDVENELVEELEEWEVKQIEED